MTTFAIAGRRVESRQSTLGIVLRDIGGLQMIVAASMVVSLFVSLLYVEVWSAISFGLGAAVTSTVGWLGYRTFADAGEPKRRHAMIVAGAGWLACAVSGSLPFLIAAWITPEDAADAMVPEGAAFGSSLAYFRNPLHCLFESMSAWTTTGLTMAVHEPTLGHGLLFYRSLAQWLGGAGMIVLSLAIIPRASSVGGLDLYQSETTGMKLRPTVIGTARSIWKIYSTLTLLVAGYLFLSLRVLLPDYPWRSALFDAVNHAMTGLATGGFSTLDDSIASYGSWAVEMFHVPPMVLGAISLPLYFTLLRQRHPRVMWRDPQFRSMMLVLLFLVPACAVLLVPSAAVANPLREGLFQVVSGVSGTGWQTSAIGDWTPAAVLVLAWGGMIVSGSAGSTVGGVKLIRAFLLVSAIRWRIRSVFLPGRAVVPFRVGDRSLPLATMRQEVADAATITFLYLIVLAVATVVVALFAGPGFTLADVLFECVSAQSTVGLSAGLTRPDMPAVVEVVFIFQMWVGRLEIFPVLVLLGALLPARRP